MRLYRYVGPPEIAEQVKRHPPGWPIDSAMALRDAALALGGARGGLLTVTFVVDADGVLRIADRSSEHVACAAGGPVRAAGELGIYIGSPAEVEEASNQSTGFCPEPACFGALRDALDRAGIDGPDAWTASFEFRRCERCHARTLIKDAQFECADGAA